jgi:hypothetical protein
MMPRSSFSPPPGLHDYASVKLTEHALERFIERFHIEPEQAEVRLRESLKRSRRLGRNRRNRTIAILATLEERPFVGLIKDSTCLTVLTWPQFEPHLAEFGRTRLPRKHGRLIRRLVASKPA